MYDTDKRDELLGTFLVDLYNELGRATDGMYPSVSLWEQLEPIEQHYLSSAAPDLVADIDMYVDGLDPVTEHHGWITDNSYSLRGKLPDSHYDRDSTTERVDIYLYIDGERYDMTLTEYMDRYADDIAAADEQEELRDRLGDESRHWTRHLLQAHDDWSRHVWNAVRYGDPTLKDRYEQHEPDRRQLEPIIAELQDRIEQLLDSEQDRPKTDALHQKTGTRYGQPADDEQDDPGPFAS